MKRFVFANNGWGSALYAKMRSSRTIALYDTGEPDQNGRVIALR